MHNMKLEEWGLGDKNTGTLLILIHEHRKTGSESVIDRGICMNTNRQEGIFMHVG